jgi:arylsulfatase A-like enzyme
MKIFLFTLLLLSTTATTAQRLPNILWLSCEDLSPHFGCYGDSTVPTPNIDRLAREGVRFTNAFTTAGVCAPSRCAIITGQYQTATGGHNMRTLSNTYPEQTGLPKEYSVVPPSDVRAFPEYLRARGYYTTNNNKTDYQFQSPPTVWDETSGQAHYKNRAPDQPFFAVFNSTLTHESQVWERARLPLRVDPARVKLPPYYPDTKTVRQDVARHFSNVRDLDDWVGEKLRELEAAGLLDSTIIFFWSDHGDGLPFFKREVYDRGLRVPLLVRFPDGKFAGTTRDELISMIDLAPTVLSLAGIPTPKAMHGQAFFGKFAAKTSRRYVFGASDRLDSHYDRVRSVHDGRFQYVRNFRPDQPRYLDLAYRKQQPMMRELLELRDAGKLNETQRLWFEPTKPAEAFYDLKTDPYQLTNLADDPRYAADLKRLRTAFETWQREVPDLGATPEKELIRRWWNGAEVPPTTADPVLTRRGDRLEIRCATEGASIGYRLLGETRWRVYTEPVRVPAGTKVQAVAHRIGYRRSREVGE